MLVLASIVLTFLTRNVPSKFNETPYLASAIYNCALMLAFIVPIVATGIGGRQASYAVRVFGIDALVLVTLSIVFLPKFYLMWGVEERRLKEMEKLNPHGGDTNTDSPHHSLKGNKPYNNSKLGASNEQNSSSPGGHSPHGARVHPVSSRVAGDGKTEAPVSSSRTSISTDTSTGKFLQPPGSGKDSPHSVSAAGRMQQSAANQNRFARPQVTSNAFVKAEPLPGQLDGQSGGQQSDIQPLMANETGEYARQPSSSASMNVAEQQRGGASEDDDDLRVDESDSVSALVSKSLRLTQRLGEFQSALDTVNKELDKRKKSKSPLQPVHALADNNHSANNSSDGSETDSPLQSGR